MTELAHFPTDLLNLITQRLNGFEIGRLWHTGDLRLMVRLESDGVTHLDLPMAQTVNTNWPKFISRFTCLESLRIVPKTRKHRIWFKGVDFRDISPTLKHLELEFDNLECALFGLPFVVPDAHPDPIWSPPTEGHMELSPFPLATHFPRLEALLLGGNFEAGPLLIPLLPQTLLTLRLPLQDINASMVHSLPPFIRHLELPELREVANSIRFPPQLLHLNLSGAHQVGAELIANLPRDLEVLDLLSWRPASKEVLPLLPPKLVSLTVTRNEPFTGTDFPPFPATIRHLDLRMDSSLKISMLPSGLQTLCVFRLSRISDADLAYLPRTLTELQIGSSFLTEKAFYFLPPSLRVLSLNEYLMFTKQSYPFMATIERLSVEELDPRVLMKAPKLCFLSVYNFTSSKVAHLKHLPSLSAIKITDSRFIANEPFLTSLPAGIKELEIPQIGPLASSHLPRSLKLLHISSNVYLYDEFVAHLPPQLTDFIVHGSDFHTRISNTAIALLPRSLETLILDSAQNITDEALAHLPPNLTECQLTNPTLLSDTCVAYLPRKLLILWLRSFKNLSERTFSLLPRNLVSLDVGSSIKLDKHLLPPDVLPPPRLKNFHNTEGEPWTLPVPTLSSKFLQNQN